MTLLLIILGEHRAPVAALLCVLAAWLYVRLIVQEDR